MSANADGRAPAEADSRLTAWEVVALAVCVALPACLAATHAANVADAAHDEAVVRALGLGWTGAWRGLDAAWCGLLAWLPLGTRALRATLASAAACGVGGGVLFVIARTVLGSCAQQTTSRVVTVVAAIVALAAALSPPWQSEAAAPVGSVLGAVLALVPVAILLGAARNDSARAPLVGLALGLAASYEPLVGLGALASVGAWAIAPLTPGPSPAGRERGVRVPAFVWRGAAGFVVGLAPFALAFARRGSSLALVSGAFAWSAGERGESPAGMPLALVREDVGITTSLLVVAGAVLGLRVVRARPAVAAMVALACLGGLAMALGAPAGPTRYGAPVLAGVGAAYVLAGVAMQAVVLAVSRARVPFAKASAAMILVLEAALPARAADDSSARADERNRAASEAWSDAALGPLPAGAMVLVRDPRVETRLYATRATGELRADLALVPLFDLGGHGAMRELARDVKLQPIWRDAALLGVEEESSLSSIAEERPLVAAYDQKWERDRSLARHLVPVGLFARFEPEPRGGSDRRRALDEFSGPAAAQGRDRLAKAIDGDPELLGITVALLRARAIALAAASERDVVAHAIDDLRPFSPRDTVSAELVRRMATTRGPLDVKDLAP